MNRASQISREILDALGAAYERLGARGAGVLLAVSGGVDSLALLAGSVDLRKRLGLKLVAVCLDHGLRPEAREESAGVATLCARLAVECRVERLSLEDGPGLEARARHARYAALEKLREELQLDYVATAHTANDQAETLLMRLARGAALLGAAGIRERRERLLRPLLRCTRAQTEAFVAERGLVPVRDPMNSDSRFLRVRIRQDVLPALERATQGPVVRHLATFAAFAAEDETFLASEAARAFAAANIPGADALDGPTLRKLPRPLRRRILAAFLAGAGFPARAERIDSADEAVGSGGRASLSRTAWLDARGGRVRIARRTAVAPIDPVELGDAWREVPGTGLQFKTGEAVAAPDLLRGALPADASPPFSVRSRARGDRVRAGSHSRKLQDLLVDLRVPAELRDALPVVTQRDGKVVWIPGIWASAGEGRYCLHARLLPGGQAPEWLVRYRLLK
jgi:tRNA(Ile)-lysidine synthase